MRAAAPRARRSTRARRRVPASPEGNLDAQGRRQGGPGAWPDWISGTRERADALASIATHRERRPEPGELEREGSDVGRRASRVVTDLRRVGKLEQQLERAVRELDRPAVLVLVVAMGATVPLAVVRLAHLRRHEVHVTVRAFVRVNERCRAAERLHEHDPDRPRGCEQPSAGAALGGDPRAAHHLRSLGWRSVFRHGPCRRAQAERASRPPKKAGPLAPSPIPARARAARQRQHVLRGRSLSPSGQCRRRAPRPGLPIPASPRGWAPHQGGPSRERSAMGTPIRPARAGALLEAPRAPRAAPKSPSPPQPSRAASGPAARNRGAPPQARSGSRNGATMGTSSRPLRPLQEIPKIRARPPRGRVQRLNSSFDMKSTHSDSRAAMSTPSKAFSSAYLREATPTSALARRSSLRPCVSSRARLRA